MQEQLQNRWLAFAQTGGIQEYLSYRQQAEAAAPQPGQKGAPNGFDRDPGAGAPGVKIQ